MSIILAGSASAMAAEYYVAPTGDNRNLGTLKQPFATIQHAVDKMWSGDTCHIRAGVYRETIDLGGKAGAPGRPITLTAYNGEKVVLDGTMAIDGKWTSDGGKVYQTKLDEDITQLFVDGQLMTLARFPNALAFSDAVWHRSAARCGQLPESPNGHVIDAGKDGKSIADAGFSFNGCVALLNFGAHATASRIVENHAEGSAEFDYTPRLFKHKTTNGYFFEGGVGNAERALLDSAQEWAYDESTRTLYLWADNGLNPQGRAIQGKVQTYAITGNAETKHVILDGLDFFATTFCFEKSDHIAIRNCAFRYYAASKRALGATGPSETALFKGSEEDFCRDITVYNCEFTYSDASALAAQYVERMTIENNLFYMNDYACVNNDNGKNEGFNPSSTINLDNMMDLVYRRNTLSVNGNAQSFSVNRYIEGKRGRRFTPNGYEPEAVPATLCEYNFHTRCGLLHTDGTSMYSPHEHVKESVARYNWFIDNGQRDFRYDGNNKPLQGVHANVYRNVCMSGIRRHSPSNGDGMHIKGDYHEVYNNLAVDGNSDLNVDTGSGGNANTTTRNNAAQEFLDKPVPGAASHNYAGGKNRKRVRELLRDPDNWDFRPRADAAELVDQGIPVKCSVKGKTIDVTAGYVGKAPDIGAYEFGDEVYWIPGRQLARASMPVPRDGGVDVPLDADLMYLIGLGGVKAGIYFGESPDRLKGMAVVEAPQNIFNVSDKYRLKKGRTYYWRVDTLLENGSVEEGDVWSFTIASGE
ncbi:hypothetical protein [Pontiella sp.]|uniref:hypothetical protein n=1 Tax=Pontiella sp. TaxID=2837462 RepID=UPI00356B5C4B